MKELLYAKIQPFGYLPEFNKIYKERTLIVEIDDDPEPMILCIKNKCREIVA